MAKEMEILDSWMQSQKEIMNTLIRVQNDFFSTMTDSTRKLQEAMMYPGSSPETEGAQKETLDRYNQMVDNMINSSKVLSEQAMKLQESWQETFKKQLDISAGIARNFMEMGREQAERAQGGQREAA